MQKLFLKILLIAIGVIVIDNIMSNLLFRGLLNFTGIKLNADVIFVGHSHTQSAIDISIVEQYFGGNVKFTKVALHGMNLSDRLALLKFYYNSSKIKPKVVVFDIDETILSTPNRSLNTHTRFYPFMADKDISRYIAANEADQESIIAREFIKTLRFNNSWILIRALKGIVEIKDDKAANRTIDNQKEIPLYSKPVSFDVQSERLFDESINYFMNKGTKLVLAYYPRLISNSTDESNHQQVRRRIQAIVGKRPYIFLDYNYEYGNRHDLFADTTHVNRMGQEVISRNIADDLRITINTTISIPP